MLVKQAITNHANKTGKKVAKIKSDLGKKLYPDANEKSRPVLMSILYNDNVKNFPLEFIPILCEELDTTPDHLFGYK